MSSVLARPTAFHLAFAVLAAQPAAAQRQPIGIAILPFGDRGSYGQDKDVFRALSLGIPATLTSELSGHPELRLVDHSRIVQALQSQGLDASGRLDAASAAKVGAEVGARYAVTGSFADFYGKVRLDARVVDTQDGRIVKVVSNNDPGLQERADLYRIIQTVAHRILAETTSNLVRGDKAEGGNVPTEALSQYSLGLLYENQGDAAKAEEHYQRALTVLPNYRDAREGMQRVRGR